MSNACSRSFAVDRQTHPWRGPGTVLDGLAMQDVFSMTYLWLKAGHIIFMVFWMAGLFILPR